jgi:hypothetical protein
MSLAPAPETHALAVMGALHEDGQTVILLGPDGAAFWPHFTAQPEYTDGQADPLDRWSKRAIGALAQAWGGEAVFPSDGPPYPPFFAWALASGQAFASPVGMLVHARAGLIVSYRGAVKVPGLLPLPAPAPNPCDTCDGQLCRTACPVGALSESGYDVPACKGWVGSAEGRACLTRGCAARRACPLSRPDARPDAQSAFHMRAFL